MDESSDNKGSSADGLVHLLADTTLEGLRGDNELAEHLALLQHLLLPYKGRVFGLDYKVDRINGGMANRYKPLTSPLPETTLIRLYLGGKVFFACQRFRELAPYTQLVLRALHNLDLQAPVCWVPPEKEQLANSDPELLRIIERTQMLFSIALKHLYEMNMPPLDYQGVGGGPRARDPNTNPAIAELYECAKNTMAYTHLGESFIKSRGNFITTNALDVSDGIERGHTTEHNFVEFVRCQPPFGFDPNGPKNPLIEALIQVSVGTPSRRIEWPGFSVDLSENLYGSWNLSDFYRSQYGFKWTGEPSVYIPNCDFTTEYLSKKAEEVVIGRRVRSIPPKFVRIVIYHPFIHISCTLAVNTISREISWVLEKIFKYASDETDQIDQTNLLGTVQKWANDQIIKVDDYCSPEETIVLGATFV